MLQLHIKKQCLSTNWLRTLYVCAQKGRGVHTLTNAGSRYCVSRVVETFHFLRQCYITSRNNAAVAKSVYLVFFLFSLYTFLDLTFNQVDDSSKMPSAEHLIAVGKWQGEGGVLRAHSIHDVASMYMYETKSADRAHNELVLEASSFTAVVL